MRFSIRKKKRYSNSNAISYLFFVHYCPLYSFYVLKTREQSDRRKLTLLQSLKYHWNTTFPRESKTSRVTGLYRGFIFSSVVSLPSYGVYLGVYLSTKDRLNESQHRSARFYAPFIAGALGKSIMSETIV